MTCGLARDFSNILGESPRHLVEVQILTPCIWSGAWLSTCLTGSRAVLMLLVPGTHLKSIFKWLYLKSVWTDEGETGGRKNVHARTGEWGGGHSTGCCFSSELWESEPLAPGVSSCVGSELSFTQVS